MRAEEELTVSLADAAVAGIDRHELVRLAIDICNIDSPGMEETAVAKYLHDWLANEGFQPRKVGLLADR
jgi:hypothetical protein